MAQAAERCSVPRFPHGTAMGKSAAPREGWEGRSSSKWGHGTQLGGGLAAVTNPGDPRAGHCPPSGRLHSGDAGSPRPHRPRSLQPCPNPCCPPPRKDVTGCLGTLRDTCLGDTGLSSTRLGPNTLPLGASRHPRTQRVPMSPQTHGHLSLCPTLGTVPVLSPWCPWSHLHPALTAVSSVAAQPSLVTATQPETALGTVPVPGHPAALALLPATRDWGPQSHPKPAVTPRDVAQPQIRRCPTK